MGGMERGCNEGGEVFSVGSGGLEDGTCFLASAVPGCALDLMGNDAALRYLYTIMANALRCDTEDMILRCYRADMPLGLD